MLTVREACELIHDPKEVDVAVNGGAYTLFVLARPDMTMLWSKYSGTIL